MSQGTGGQRGRVLVLGDYGQTVTVVRSLGRAGYEVTLGTEHLRSSTGLSRHVSDVWVYDNSSPQRFYNHLEAFLRNERPDFVFTVGESQLRRLIEVAARFEPLAIWVNPDFDTVARCFDKRAMYELARELGLSSMPCAAGVRHNCHVGAADGKLIAYFQQKVLRTDEPDHTGSGVAAVSVAPSAELRAHCEALTRALRYTGVGCIQFLVNEGTASAAFLEFNARMDSTTALPYRMGLDYPLLAMQLAVYRKACARGRTDAERLLPAPHPATYPAGTAYHWLQGDLEAFRSELRSGKMPARAIIPRVCSMAWLSMRSYHLTFDWRDPLPSIHMFWRKYLKNLRRRRLPIARPAAR